MTNPLRTDLESQITDYAADLNARFALLSPDEYYPIAVPVLRRMDRKAALQDMADAINANLSLLEVDQTIDVHALRQGSLWDAFNNLRIAVEDTLVGVEASGDDAGEEPEWLPEGALFHLDTINGHYWNGAECTINDLLYDHYAQELDLTAEDGAFSSHGFEPSWAWNSISAKGTMKDALLAGARFVFKGRDPGCLLAVYGSGFKKYRFAETVGVAEASQDLEGTGTPEQTVQSPDPVPENPDSYTVEVVLSDTTTSIKVGNGTTVTAAGVSGFSPAPDRVSIGNDDGGSFVTYIQEFTVYAAA